MASGAKDADNGMLIEEVELKVRHRYERSWITGERIALLVLIAVGVVLVIVGIVLLAMASSAAKKCSNDELNNGEGSGSTSSPSYKISKRCESSAEAKRIGLDEFVDRVKETYYTLHPFSVPFHPDIDDVLGRVERTKSEYVAYDLTQMHKPHADWCLLGGLIQIFRRASRPTSSGGVLPSEFKAVNHPTQLHITVNIAPTRDRGIGRFGELLCSWKKIQSS